ARTSDGSVWDWGDNTYGGLGDGTTTSSLLPHKLTTISGAASVYAGRGFSLVLKPDGTLWSFGYNVQGQIGQGAMDTQPTAINAFTGLSSLVGGGYHMLGLKGDGTAWAWGLNDSGQLGDGTTNTSRSPKQITAITGA